MKAVLVARTIGPSKNLARIAVELVDRGHEVASVLSKNENSFTNVRHFEPDVVLITTSSPATKKDTNIDDELTTACFAFLDRIPFAIFADTYGSYNRKKITKHIIEKCSTLFVPDAEDKKLALQENNWKNVIVSGVPLWEEFADTSNSPAYQAVREKLDIIPTQTLIAWTFCKDSNVNKKMLEDIYSAFSMLPSGLKDTITFIPMFHPGDQNLKVNPYHYNVALSPFEKYNLILNKAYKKSEDLLQGLDILISSNSTLGLTAIYRRKTVIEYLPDHWIESRLYPQTKRRIWPPAELGAIKCENPEKLAEGINSLNDIMTKLSLANAQRKNYPDTKGGAAKIIVDELERLAQQK